MLSIDSKISQGSIITDQPNGLHSPSGHFYGVRDGLCNQTGKRTTLHSFGGREITVRHMLNL